MKFKILRKILLTVLYILLFFLYIWSIPAIYFMTLKFGGPPNVVTFGFVIIFLLIFILLYRKKYKIYIMYGICFLIILCFNLMRPSNERNWTNDVAVLPSIIIKNNIATIRNIRDFEYETELTYTIKYYDRTFDINELTSVDYILSYWDGNVVIAHTMLRFGFENGSHICVSVETRREKDELQTGLRGLYNQYELIYLLADESDLLMLRTNYRNENVYIFPLKVPQAAMKKLFLQIMGKVHSLESKPKFYNTLNANCITSLLDKVRKITNRNMIFDYRYILNGKSDELGYERGIFITNGLSYTDFRNKHHINQYISDSITKQNYSQAIQKSNGYDQ